MLIVVSKLQFCCFWVQTLHHKLLSLFAALIVYLASSIFVGQLIAVSYIRDLDNIQNRLSFSDAGIYSKSVTCIMD